jgi:hypothetical protein
MCWLPVQQTNLFLRARFISNRAFFRPEYSSFEYGRRHSDPHADRCPFGHTQRHSRILSDLLHQKHAQPFHGWDRHRYAKHMGRPWEHCRPVCTPLRSHFCQRFYGKCQLVHLFAAQQFRCDLSEMAPGSLSDLDNPSYGNPTVSRETAPLDGWRCSA